MRSGPGSARGFPDGSGPAACPSHVVARHGRGSAGRGGPRGRRARGRDRRWQRRPAREQHGAVPATRWCDPETRLSPCSRTALLSARSPAPPGHPPGCRRAVSRPSRPSPSGDRMPGRQRQQERRQQRSPGPRGPHLHHVRMLRLPLPRPLPQACQEVPYHLLHPRQLPGRCVHRAPVGRSGDGSAPRRGLRVQRRGRRR